MKQLPHGGLQLRKLDRMNGKREVSVGIIKEA